MQAKTVHKKGYIVSLGAWNFPLKKWNRQTEGIKNNKNNVLRWVSYDFVPLNFDTNMQL